jgi:hypothetical protein
MSARPKVSICIPAYNHEKYVAVCLESVLNQSFSDLEVVITDDCSTDGTVDVIKSISDPRIRLFQSTQNRGTSATANKNIQEARGEFLCLLASDDMFHPQKVEKQLAFLKSHPNTGAVFSYMRYIDEDGVPFSDHPNYRYIDVENRSREEWLRSFFFEGNALAAPTVMVRRDVLDRVGPFDSRLRQTQDFDLWIRMCFHYDVHIIPERLVDYRIRANQQNTSANTPENQAQTLWELSKILTNFCAITDEELLYKIFPELAGQDYTLLPLEGKIVRLALQANMRSTRVFGLELLYSLLGDRELAQVLEKSGYDLPTFYNLVKKEDVLGVGAELRAQKASAELHEAEVRAAESLSRLKAEYDWAADQARRWETEAVNAAQVAERSDKERKEAVRSTQEWKQKYEQAIAQSHVWQMKYEKSALPLRIRRLFSALRRH